MREATQAEFLLAMNRAGQVRRMGTKRTYDVFYSDRGTEVASKHQVMTRGKVTSETYMVNPAYLRTGELAEEMMSFKTQGGA